MEAIIKKENGTLYLKPSGRLDTVNSADLKAKIDPVGADGVDIDFDFTEVDYISSAGLRLLVALHKQTAACGKKLIIRNPGRVVREVFAVSGFNKTFTIV
ncbi:MAG: STAS domain-containing protein [Clostridia bacterium]|nr:STAS domain-containing protein [Clostridia bacterium]